MLAALLRAEGFTVEEAPNGPAGLLVLERLEADAIFLDLMMPPGPNGLETLTQIRARGIDAPVIMMSGKAMLADAVRATQLGAFQFLEKPLSPEAVLVTLRSAVELGRTRHQNRALRQALETREEMVGQSPPILRIRQLIAQVAPTDARVLVTGESGTGQGTGRRRDPPRQRPEPGAVRHGELRRDPARAGRVRDVRARARRLYGCGGAASRPLRAGRWRDPLPRRDRRPESRSPGEAAPHARDGHSPAAGCRAADQGQRARGRRDQPAARSGGGGGDLSRRPLLPPQHLPDSHPAAA